MYILIVSRGVPSDNDPLNGVFEFDQAKAIVSETEFKVIYISLDFRSIRRKRRLGFYKYKKNDVEIYCLSLPIGPIYYKLFYFIGIWAVFFLFKKIKKKYGLPKVVHAHFTVYSGIASIIKKKYKIPFIITEHSSLVTKSVLSKSTKFWVKKSYPFADTIIAVSGSLSNNILNKLNYKSIVINNVLDTKSFSFSPRTNRGKFQFVAVGNLVYGKGHDVLINAFSKLKADNIVLKIIGGGPLKSELEKLISDLNLTNSVFLLGRLNRNQINANFQESDAFVLASRGETFGVSYIEAMATGLPVIATKCGGPEEFVNSENGCLVPIDNENSLFNAMNFIVENIETFNKGKISSAIKEKYSPSYVSSQLSMIYRDLIEII